MHTFWMVICSNSILAIGIAIVALLLGYAWKNPAALHVIWIVVLLKLFTPPIVTVAIPILAAAPPVAESTAIPDSPSPVSRAGFATRSAVKSAINIDDAPAGRTIARDTSPASNFPNSTIGMPSWSALLTAIWIFGSIAVAIRHAMRIRRFAAFVRTCEHAPADIVALTARIAAKLGLKSVPAVVTTPRAVPPLVWWLGSPARLVLPRELFAQLSEPAQMAIIVHELSHIARRDHLVRMLELLATIVFWWHPLVWLSCWKLRDLEEQCCDSRVLDFAPERSKDYAMALVDTVEFLSEQPAVCALLTAAVRSRCSLSRRIRMMAHRQTNRLSLRSTLIVAALVACPLTMALAADHVAKPNPTAEKPAGAPAILEGRVTDESGKPLAGARVWVAIPATDMRFFELDADHRQFQTKTDADGNYRIEISGITKPTQVSIDASMPHYKRLSGIISYGPPTTYATVSPGAVFNAAIKLKPALYFSGVVLDEDDHPIEGVAISGNANNRRGSAGVERTVTDTDGKFGLFDYPSAPPKVENESTTGTIWFFHPDYVSDGIDDIYAVPPDQRTRLRIVLQAGRKLSGTVRDATGNPAPHVEVRAELTLDAKGKPVKSSSSTRKKAETKVDFTHSKGVETDAHGRFRFRGLADGPTTVTVLDFAIEQKASTPIVMDRDVSDFDIHLHSMGLPKNIKSYDVLGMRLADATPEIGRAFSRDLGGPPRPFWGDGVVILDPGKNSERLGIGQLEKGDVFWMVGRKDVGSVREFVASLLLESLLQVKGKPTVRVVYFGRTARNDFSNTQYMKFTPDDIEQLKSVWTSLDRYQR